MSKFNVVKSSESLEGAFYNIGDYYFYRSNNNDAYSVIEQIINVDLDSNKQYIYNDIIGILKDIDQFPVYSNVRPNNNNDDEQEVYIKWLTDIPKEEYEYIRDFESEICGQDDTLFHDFMKRYIEVCKLEDLNIDCSISFIGYTLIDNKFEIKVKAFNYKVLLCISRKIIEQFTRYNFIVKSYNLNWLRLDKLVVEDNKRFDCADSDKLLNNTLKNSMETIFKYLFKKIDKDGFVDLRIDEKKDTKDEIEIKEQIKSKKQIYGLLKPYLKLSMNNKFVYLHDEPSIDLKDELNNRIFSFSPRLMQYYQKQWFEDLIGKIIMKLKDDRFQIKAMKQNKIFNFYEDGEKNNNIEIDCIIDVEKNGVRRTIGIECKKTLKKNYTDETKKKIYNKIVKSGKAVIDAYIIVGYFKESGFSGDLVLEDVSTHNSTPIFDENEYSSEDVFIQYLSICDTNIENIKNKITKCIDIIYQNS